MNSAQRFPRLDDEATFADEAVGGVQGDQTRNRRRAVKVALANYIANSNPKLFPCTSNNPKAFDFDSPQAMSDLARCLGATHASAAMRPFRRCRVAAERGGIKR
jgi:hypothetical protein